MDSDQGKLFIGGISWETNEDKLREYFQGYGEVLQTVVMRDKISGKPRGFGFVVFADPNILDAVLQDRHVIDGRTVEAKRALSREEQHVSRNENSSEVQNFGNGGGTGTKKIFVGGLPATVTEEGFRQYFETYGVVNDVVIMYDQQTNRPRGFGFISFDSEDAVDRVLHKTFHDLNGKQVEVKRALPKDASPGGSGRAMRGGSGGQYQNYGSSAGNINNYDGRMESSRYMQQGTGGGFPSYGSSAYNMTGYGHGPTYNGMGYGFGNYGNAANPGYNMPGYGHGPTSNGMGYGFGNYGNAANPGYNGAAGGGYSNLNAPNSGYGGPAAGYGNPNAGYGGPQTSQRNSWGPLPASGYGFGSAAGTASRQSPNGASGVGNQGFSLGVYNQHGHDASAGRSGSAVNGSILGDAQAAAVSGYAGDGYADGNSGWRSDPSRSSTYYDSGHIGSVRPGRQ